MASIEELCNKLQDIIDSANLSNNYKVFYWAENLDSRVYEDDGLKEFIPCIISDISGNYIPIPNVKIADCSATFEVIFPLENKADVQLLYDALVDALVGKSVLLGEIIGGSDYRTNCTFNISKPQLTNIDNTKIEELNQIDRRLKLRKTKMYGVMAITLYFKEMPNAGGYEYGNQYSVYISTNGETYTKLDRIELGAGTNRQSDNEQYLGSDQITSFNSTSSVGFSISFMLKNRYQEPMNSLLADAVEGGNQNRKYYLQIRNGIEEITSNIVIMDTGDVDFSMGNIVMITATFKKAWAGL